MNTLGSLSVDDALYALRQAMRSMSIAATVLESAGHDECSKHAAELRGAANQIKQWVATMEAGTDA